MSNSKHTDLVCIIIIVLSLVLTLVFINGEALGIEVIKSDETADAESTFTESDLSAEWSASSAVYINLETLEITSSSGAYVLDGDICISSGGTYVLSGAMAENSRINVSAKGSEVTIVLNNASIENTDRAPVYISDASKVRIILEEETLNYLTLSGSLCDEDVGYGISAALYSKSDLCINGSGTLCVSSYDVNAIRTSEDMIITGGTYDIDSGENGIVGHNSLRIDNGTFLITAANDGMKSNAESEDESKGYVLINGGQFTINAGGDAISAETILTIEDGIYYLTTGEGASETEAESFDFGGGMSMQEDMELPDGTEMPEGMELPDGMEMPEDMELPDGMEMPDGIELPDGAELPDGTQGSDGSSSGGGMQAPGGMTAPGGGNSDGFGGGSGSAPSDMQNSDEELEAGIEESSSDTSEDSSSEGSTQKPDRKPDQNTDSASESSEDSDGKGVHQGMGGGQMPGGFGGNSSSSSDESLKGIKAGTAIVINGGTFAINTEDDAIHTNGTMTINGGTFDLATTDDGLHADESLTINSGTIIIEMCYEGIESKEIVINDGYIDITSSDDAINAGSGSGGGFGFGGSADGVKLEINGGEIHIDAGGDGLDSNCDLIINGGTVYVDGPTSSANGALDSGTESGGSLLVNGGTVLAVGASGMAEGFEAESGQVSLDFTLQSSFSAGDVLTISDSTGNVIFEYTLLKTGNSIVFSSPDLVEGETYTATAGEITATAEASYGSSSSGFGGFGGGGNGGSHGGGNNPGGSRSESNTDGVINDNNSNTSADAA